MKKLMLILILGIVLISCAQAEVQTAGPFKIYTDVDIFQTHTNCTYNNITSIIYPNSSLVVRDVSMTKNGSNYNYTLTSNFVTVLGRYIVNGEGDVDGISTDWHYDFEITPTGKKDFSIFDNSLILIFLSLAIFFLIMGIKLEMEWIGFLSSLMFLLVGVYITIYGFSGLANFYTQGVGITLIGIGITIMFVSIVEWLSR